MKRSILALAGFLAITAGAPGPANAVEVDVGPGGIHVGPQRHYGYRSFNRYSDCRVIIDRRVNRYGERVTVRRRVCD
jgi:hypothetical protein